MIIRQFYITLVLSTILNFTITAQTYFKIDPVLIGFGIFGGNLERVVSPKASIQFQGYYVTPSQQFRNVKGFGFSLAARFYFGSKYEGCRGVYFSPIIRSVPADYNSSAFGGGLLVGYQHLFSDNKFSFEVGLGPLFSSATRGTGLDTNLQGVLTLGYRLFRGEFSD
jgi:hypothetical protein